MNPVVSTIESQCKRCYSCIKNCPAKAIKVVSGQAIVVPERCIACGYCVRVCPQHAKYVRDGIEGTMHLLNNGNESIALVAPSLPAACDNVSPGQVVSGLKMLGFSKVCEVAYGADLVGAEYKSLLKADVMPLMISSPCPSITSFIVKHFPELALCLAPVVSPMIAMGRVVREVYGPDINVVFIGPCISKKKEMDEEPVSGIIDEVLTFDELKSIFQLKNISPPKLEDCEMDGPMAGLGRIFPVSGGLLKVAELDRDVLNNDIVVTEGRDRVLEIIDKVSKGEIEARFLDILFCDGCINGPKMSNELSVFVRKDRVVNFLKSRQSLEQSDKIKHDDINLHRTFTAEKLESVTPTEEQLRAIMIKTGKFTAEDELNCGSCGYDSCREKAIAVFEGFAEAEMCLPFMIEKLESVQHELTTSNEELKASLETLRKTQKQLVQSEKMASVGQLAAGVAHELNNPLGGILLYSSFLLEKAQSDSRDTDDLNKIISETERCKNIIQGLLDFSKQTTLKVALSDVNEMLNRMIEIVRHQQLFYNIKINKDFNPSIPKVYLDIGQMQQVFLNIILNAAEAMEGNGQLYVRTDKDDIHDFLIIEFKDNGPGIPLEEQGKIFDPFYTTKPYGQGTGLGLAIAYGTIYKHKGEFAVESNKDEGAKFTIKIPIEAKFEQEFIESAN